MYVVTGATGNTGSVVARQLLEAGKKVRLLVRDPAKAEALAAKGAEIVRGDLTDNAAVTRAFTGATGVYLMSPPDLTTNDFIAERSRLMGTLAATARAAGVGHVVLLSSLGAEHAEGTGPIRTVRAAEQALEATGLPVTVVRAAYFLSNWAGVLPVAQKDGVLPSFLPADLAMPMIAVNDIGPVAARALLDGPRGRRIIELAGPREVTPADVAAAAAKALQRPVKVVEAPLEAVVPTFMSFGISENVAGLYREMYQGVRAGKLVVGGAGNELVRGPTSLDDGIRALLG
jgi:uncharacterized protein YbjT (DUF2867 family)